MVLESIEPTLFNEEEVASTQFIISPLVILPTSVPVSLVEELEKLPEIRISESEPPFTTPKNP